jgi:hypothetical protein
MECLGLAFGGIGIGDSYSFAAYIARRVIDILESDIDENGRSCEEVCMSFCDGGCESVFLSGVKRGVVRDDVKWHFDSAVFTVEEMRCYYL